MSVRRGGIPGPESRTGLVRPTMSEAEFERRVAGPGTSPAATTEEVDEPSASPAAPEPEPAGRNGAGGASSSSGPARSRSRSKPAAKIRRVQRMFAIEEELDKKLWLYAIHIGKDRSDVVNDLLRPVVASMVLYDSRDRRSGRSSDGDAGDGQGGD
jgi:hypothetical protein